MVRKASTIDSIDEFGLTCVGKFGDSVEGVIWFGRQMSYYSKYSDYWPKVVDKSIKELIEALEKADLIRDDIEPKHFSIGYLYRMVFRRAGGVVETSKFPVAKKSLGQWCFTAFGILSYILCLVTIVDIIRKKPKLWGLWILCALAFLGPQLTTSPNGFQVGVRFGILNLSQWTRHLNETNHFELCFPIGAIIYWCRRRQLLAKKSGPAGFHPF